MPSGPRPVHTSSSASAPLRILMIHGYTQSGPLFRSKTRALEKKLLKAFPAGVSLVYPTAPIRLTPADVPGFSPLTSTATSEDSRNTSNSGNSQTTLGEASADAAQASSALANTAEPGGTGTGTDTDGYGWWRRRGDTEPYYYEGMELGLASLARTLKEDGPFDGVIGFSQGGSAAGLVASLLEPGRRHAFEDAAKHRGGMQLPESFWMKRKRRTNEENQDKSSQAESRRVKSGESDSDALGSEQSNKTATAATNEEPTAQIQPNSQSTTNPNSNTDINEEDDDDIYEPVHPPLKFAVSYSGYGTLNPLYAGFFNPRIRTPMLHFIGSLDTVVEERRSLMLVDACEDGGSNGREGEGSGESGSSPSDPRNNRRVIYHPGGHFLPSSQKQLVEALVGFIREAMAEAVEQKEERKAGLKSTEVDNDMQNLELHSERNARI